MAKNFQAAVDHFSRVIAASPANGLAIANRGVAYKDLGRLEEAARDFRQALPLLEKQSSKEYTQKLLNETESAIQARKHKAPVQSPAAETLSPETGPHQGTRLW